jgi:hypothetical protein
MCIALDPDMTCSDEKINKRLDTIRERIKKEKIKTTSKFTQSQDVKYYLNTLPNIPESRDVLIKPSTICTIYVNWKHLPFTNMSCQQILDKGLMKMQYGWNVSIVDKEHTRNSWSDKEIVWAIFDSEQSALKHRSVFNSMFITALERDAVDEYKKFKHSPLKRPLTFDKIIGEGAYELYKQVDNGEL